jgi:tellurite resistance protein TerC
MAFLLNSFLQDHQGLLLLIFGAILVVAMVLDLGLLNKKSEVITFKAALRQSLFWVAIAMGFFVFLFYTYSENDSIDYLTAYVTEYALSVDNIFVIILILRYFRVEEKYYHKILFWGILGALVMRATFIFVGEYLIHQFEWILYIFGAFLLFTGFRLLFQSEEDEDNFNPEGNVIIKFARRYLNFTNHDAGGKFFVRKMGKLFFTRLFMVVLLIESTDLIFAVDSIPAAFGITQDPFILYTSNIFAILGLRAMFFMLSGILDRFYLLSKGLSFVLIFIGAKMFLEIFHNVPQLDAIIHIPKIPSLVSLLVVVSILGLSIVFSLLYPKKEDPLGIIPDSQVETPSSSEVSQEA